MKTSHYINLTLISTLYNIQFTHAGSPIPLDTNCPTTPWTKQMIKNMTYPSNSSIFVGISQNSQVDDSISSALKTKKNQIIQINEGEFDMEVSYLGFYLGYLKPTHKSQKSVYTKPYNSQDFSTDALLYGIGNWHIYENNNETYINSCPPITGTLSKGDHGGDRRYLVLRDEEWMLAHGNEARPLEVVTAGTPKIGDFSPVSFQVEGSSSPSMLAPLQSNGSPWSDTTDTKFWVLISKSPLPYGKTIPKTDVTFVKNSIICAPGQMFLAPLIEDIM